VAELECGHNQHVRHKPPLQWREWVLQPETRRSRIGTPLPCPLCDRAEMPEAVRKVRQAEWDETTLPAGLRRAHRLGRATWGRILVRCGRLRFRAATDPPTDVQLDVGHSQPIPPGVEHEVEPLGPVEVTLEFLTVERTDDAPGGDPACWAGLVCSECGGVAGDGSGHRPGCSAQPPAES
jgi:tellurite methyltransferase